MDCAQVGKDYDIPIISDGGVRTSGDATKALAAGASTSNGRKYVGRNR